MAPMTVPTASGEKDAGKDCRLSRNRQGSARRRGHLGKPGSGPSWRGCRAVTGVPLMRGGVGQGDAWRCPACGRGVRPAGRNAGRHPSGSGTAVRRVGWLSVAQPMVAAEL